MTSPATATPTLSRAAAARMAGDIATAFTEDTRQHILTVAHDEGLYRHLHFARPETSSYFFELVTWPGMLTIHAAVGTYTFTRHLDMLTFFRGGPPNPSYWAEKVQRPTQTKEYSERRFRATIDEWVADRQDRHPGLGDAVQEKFDDYDIFCEDGARQFLAEFDFKGVGFADSWEWDLHDFTPSFLWCCHTITWGINQYDAVPRPVVATATTSTFFSGDDS